MIHILKIQYISMSKSQLNTYFNFVKHIVTIHLVHILIHYTKNMTLEKQN